MEGMHEDLGSIPPSGPELFFNIQTAYFGNSNPTQAYPFDESVAAVPPV